MEEEEEDVVEGKAESPAEISPHIPEQHQQQYQNGAFHNPEHYPRPPEQNVALVHGTSSLMPNGAHQSPIHSQGYNGNVPFYQPGPEHHSMEMISPEIVSYPTTSPTTAGPEYNHHAAQFDGFLPGDFSFMPSHSAPRIVGMVEGGVDWLNLEFDSPNNGDLQAQYHTGAMQSAYPQPQLSNGLEEALQVRGTQAIQQAISAQLMPMRSQDSKAPIAKSFDGQATAQQWPFDHTPNPEAQKWRLPPLRDILQGAVLSNEPDNGAVIKSLIQLMSSSYLPEVDVSMDVNMMSAMELLKNSLELYFTEFHAVLPLVHVPTFQMTKVPTVTLAAMACIGAMYSDDQQGTEQSWSLSEICIQMIAYLVSRHFEIGWRSGLRMCVRETATARIFTTRLIS